MEQHRTPSPQAREYALVPVTCIPANYRNRLPRHAHLCYVEGPAWDESDECYIRVGATPEWLAATDKKLRITDQEAAVIFDSLFQSQDAPTAALPQPIFAAPSYLFPAALSELDTSRSYDLTGEMEQAMRGSALSASPVLIDAPSESLQNAPEDGMPHRLYDRWFVTPTGIADSTRHMVRATHLLHRFSGRTSGPVYTVWMDDAALAQAMPLEKVGEMFDVQTPFETLDSHTQRVAVAAFALTHSAKPPVDEPEPQHEVGISAATLEDDYQLVATKDPIYLRKEDVLAIDPPESSLDAQPNPGAQPILNSQEIILENALAAIEHEQAYLRAVIEQRTTEVQQARAKRRVALLAQQRADAQQCEQLACLRGQLHEALRWYRHLPRRKRGERVLYLCALDAGESPAWRGQPDAAYRLIVGVPPHTACATGDGNPPSRCATPAPRARAPVPVGQAVKIVA